MGHLLFRLKALVVKQAQQGHKARKVILDNLESKGLEVILAQGEKPEKPDKPALAVKRGLEVKPEKPERQEHQVRQGRQVSAAKPALKGHKVSQVEMQIPR